MARKQKPAWTPLRKPLGGQTILGLIAAFFLLYAIRGCFSPAMIATRAWFSKSSKRIMTLTVTGYCPCGICCNWRREWLLWPVIAGGPFRGTPKKVGYCADGTKAQVSAVAADTSLFPFGTLMYVPGYGWGEVRDVGSDIKGSHIDVFFRTHQEAAAWGVRRLKVSVYK